MQSRTPPISSEFRGGGFEPPKPPPSVRHWMSLWEITFVAVRGDAVCVQSHSSPIFVNQTRSHNASQTKKYTMGVFSDTLQLEESRSPGLCVWFSLICSLSQELADLPIVAIDNLQAAIVGWPWYRRRHKAEAYIYRVTQKTSSSPWTTGTAQFKFKVTYVVMFSSSLNSMAVSPPPGFWSASHIASSVDSSKSNFTRFSR